jgi:hypothetical protein
MLRVLILHWDISHMRYAQNSFGADCPHFCLTRWEKGRPLPWAPSSCDLVQALGRWSLTCLCIMLTLGLCVGCRCVDFGDCELGGLALGQ